MWRYYIIPLHYAYLRLIYIYITPKLKKLIKKLQKQVAKNISKKCKKNVGMSMPKSTQTRCQKAFKQGMVVCKQGRDDVRKHKSHIHIPTSFLHVTATVALNLIPSTYRYTLMSTFQWTSSGIQRQMHGGLSPSTNNDTHFSDTLHE